MGIPPAVPVKAAKSIGPCPRIVARIVQAHNGQHTLRGHARACRRRGSRRPHCDSYGKYSLSETDVQRSANDANVAKNEPALAGGVGGKAVSLFGQPLTGTATPE